MSTERARKPVWIALGLALGCRPAADHDTVGSPSGSIAGTEASAGASSSRTPAGSRSPSGRTNPGLIAVTSAALDDADPCEQICGRLGECAMADDDDTARAAGGLELECLDLCVHSPDDSPAKRELLACGSAAGQCEPLQACAQRQWVALAAARVDPMVTSTAASGESPCKSRCRWMFGCLYTGLPPGEGYLEPHFVTMLDTCLLECDAGQETYSVEFAECLVDHCGYDRQGECYAYLNH